ncbi:PAS domain S-box-containing protein [Desulfobaculum xiamenense]|uniref:histidine kinase n=1 Tax=Desulfobaculum xiamenense TaxID=995050 RepID=A0A846QLS1_9BACT|nr:transporter substrate-binding domain-containing protein [Desulfobaculum xiamenense]NJB69051.1 PAS domain S-box-containing protein [Desulfobaculum xiamenense]
MPFPVRGWAAFRRARYVVVLACAAWLMLVVPAQAAQLVARGDKNYPPYEFLENGRPTGFNVDMLRAVAEVMGLDVRIDLGEWNEVRSQLEEGRIDIITGMFSSEERDKVVDFSLPHVIVSNSIFVRLGSSIRGLDDLEGKQVLVQRGDIMHDWAQKNLPHSVLVPVPEQADALFLLSAGRHDAALIARLQGQYAIHRHKLDNLVPVGPPILPMRYCFAVREGDEELRVQLNEGLTLLKRTGRYEAIYDKWFGVQERQAASRRWARYGLWILTPLAGLLAVMGIWSWSLRREVGRKTSELRAELEHRERVQAELRKAQSYVRNIIDSMPSVMVAVDGEGRVTHMNAAAAHVLGWRDGEHVGRPVGEALPELRRIEADIAAALRERRSIKRERQRSMHDGNARYEDVMIYPLVANGIEGAVIRIDDVTRRVRMEEMMMQTEKMMSVGGLAAGMAHEINNPLGGIVQGVQNIRRRLLDDMPANRRAAEDSGCDLSAIGSYAQARSLPRMLDGVEEAARRAGGIVRNMLDFSRRSESVLADVDVTAVLEKAVELASKDYDFKKNYDFRNIRIMREYADALPLVPCVGTELEQVFLNILGNAAHAMRDAAESGNEPEIVLRAALEDDYVRVEIADNGPGMDDETRLRVFEPFFTTKEPGVGTGLGLSVSYFIIVDNHGGTLAVESEPGHGCTFTIRLPLVRQGARRSGVSGP